MRPATQAPPTSPEPDAAPRPVLGARPWQRELRVLVLVLSDLAALFTCGAVAYLAWARPVHAQAPQLYLGLAPLLLLFAAGYARAGLYPGFGLGPVETLRRLSLVTASSYLVLAAFSFALKLPHRYSRLTFLLALVLSLFAVPLLRHAVGRWAARRRWWQEPVAIVGGADAVRGTLGATPGRRLGYRPAAILDPAAERDGEVDGVPLFATAGGLDAGRLRRIAARGVRVVVLLTERDPSVTDLDLLHGLFHRVVTLRRLSDLPVEGVQVRNLGGVLGIEYTNNLLLRRNRVLKRALDLALGGLALVAALPAIAAAVVAVKLVSRGPAFFVQRRAGLDGRPIAVPKIRTMHRDAEQRLERHLAADPALRAEWEEHMKLRHDPRLVPVVGRLLRRFSLDELPQLWSVVVGRMSLVGPRPFPDYHLDQFSPRFLALRQRVRPGITGLWQVTVRSSGGIAEQEAADSHYIRNWSLWLDLYVLARTLGAVISGKGAY